MGCTVPAAPAEGISVQERNHKDSAKFQSTRHRKPSQGRASCASESGTYIVNFGGKGRTSIQASLGCWHHFCSHALQERMAGWSVYSRFTSPSFWILETKVPSLSGKSHNLQDAEDRLLPILTAKFYMTIILQKNIASAVIFLVQIRITWRAFSKKSFSFIAFHLCNLLTKGRKELPMQTLPQKYKDIYLLGRTEIQKSKRQNWDSEVVHPNLLRFFLLRTLSSQYTRDLSQLLWFSHPFWFSSSCFYSSQFSLFHLSSVPYVLQAKLPFPKFS